MSEKNKQVMEDEIEQTETEEIDAEIIDEPSEEFIEEPQLQEQIDELNTRLLRVHADYDNFRRRTKEEKEAAAKYRAQSLVEDLLSVLDNFERALVVESTSEETKSVLQGMEMVYRQLKDSLKKEGVETIESVGKPFDPHLHQAVMKIEDENFEADHVVEEFQKGYKLKDRIIRPAMVKVNS
jgi:molecular chaperone GrpE